MKSIHIAMLCGLAMGACGRGYSQGERAGTVYKFSQKGLFLKSWEGEINLGGLRAGENGAVANVWSFTVVDDRLRPAIQKALDTGKPIKVGYTQWVVSPCSMDSSYEIVSVQEPAP